jgi:acyl carrier protein
MGNKVIIERVLQVLNDIFSIEDINGEISQDNTEDWDSIGHVRLMMALEKEFNIDIPIDEAMELSTLENIADYIFKK